MVKRSNRDHWAHTVARMRTRMVGSQRLPDLTEQETTTIVELPGRASSARSQPYDANSRLPTRAADRQGRALPRRCTYDLVNTHAEPHDVAVDPKGNAWVAERAGKLGRFDPKTLEFAEIDTPPGPAAKDRQSLGNPQIDSKGILWVADGPNNRWLSYDTNDRQVPCLCLDRAARATPAATAWRCIPTAPSGRPAPARKHASCSRKRCEFKFYEAPAAKTHQRSGRLWHRGRG